MAFDQTGRPMELVVGREAGYQCTWQLDDAHYAYLRTLLQAERTASTGAAHPAPRLNARAQRGSGRRRAQTAGAARCR